MSEMKNAVLYARVSTAKQAEEGVSKDAQLAQTKSWSEGMGYQVLGAFQDNGISGKRADNRPGLQEALDLACKEKAALVVYSLSRLARSTKDALAIAERLDKAGADLISLSENIDTTNAAGKMVFRMLAVLSEFERDLVSERIRAAFSHKRTNGYKAGGSLPFGFEEDGEGRLSPNTEEQKVIAVMRRLRGEGLSLRAIAAELEKQGITSKTGKGWSAKTVNGVLKRVS
jgi:site-specific DNA recombinase